VEQSTAPSGRLDIGVIIALFVALIVRPTLYTLIVPFRFSGVPEGAVSSGHWWSFFGWILFWEWMLFGVVWWALRRGGRRWSELGVDWTFFVRHRVVFGGLIIAAALVAALAPFFIYHGDVPRVSRTLAICRSPDRSAFYFLWQPYQQGFARRLLPGIAIRAVCTHDATSLVDASGDDGGVCLHTRPPVWNRKFFVLFG
jgi:hypothetical protein